MHNFFTNQVYVKQFTVLNDVSNCKPMIVNKINKTRTL